MSWFHAGHRRRTALLAAEALEGSERAQALAHLESCESCRQDRDAYAAALESLPRGEHFWVEPPIPAPALVTRVLARVDERRISTRQRPLARWALASASTLAVVALLLFGTGREPSRVVPESLGAASLPARLETSTQVNPELLRRIERNLAREQAARYLTEAQDLLLAVASPADCEKQGETLDLADEARRSRDLLARRSLLLDADHDAVAAARPVLDDVSDMLREVAALPSCVRRSQLQPMQEEIRRRRLIMKADLLSRELQG